MQSGASKVYITSRKASACEAACKELNSMPNKSPNSVAISVPADAAKVEEIVRLVAEVRKTTDHVDVLFANAGATWGDTFDNYTDAAFSKVMDLNVKSVFNTIQKFTPLLQAKATKESPSKVIVTASVAGLTFGGGGGVGTFAYNASKAAAIHLTKHLALELAPRNLRCYAICPGYFPSKMANAVIEMQGGVKTLGEQNPSGRLGEPEDIAAVLVFLSSRASNHLNGTVITIDGGSYLGATSKL
jgi:NAD(P)-dependent dehydrogenase (short-subunit alcohol dehydrogenase family)